MLRRGVALKTTVRTRVPTLPFQKIATSILGIRYSLSIVLCGDALARKLNRKYRNKTYAPNVLSFPLDKETGEILLNVRKADQEARALSTTLKKRIALLFVHGCFHLKGYSHGKTMDQLEQKTLRIFKLV